MKRKVKTETHKNKSTVVRNTAETEGEYKDHSVGLNSHEAPDIRAGRIEIRSLQDFAEILGCKSMEFCQQITDKESMVWKKLQDRGFMRELVANGHLKSAEVEVIGALGQRISGYCTNLDQNELTTWIQKLCTNPNTVYEELQVQNKSWNKKQECLSGPAAALITVVVAIATQGAGAGLATMIGVKSTLAISMMQAAITCVASKGTISTINSKGNLKKVAKDVFSKDMVKALMRSLATAGIAHYAEGVLPVTDSEVMNTLGENAFKAFADSAFSMAMDGTSIKDALKSAVRQTLSGTLAKMGAAKIGDIKNAGDMSYITHKLSHALVGAAAGAIASKKWVESAIAGGVGAAGAEMVAEALQGFFPDNTQAELQAEHRRKGRALTEAEQKQVILRANQNLINTTKVLMGTVALASKLDVDKTVNAAGTALENNWIQGVYRLAVGAYGTYSAYCIYNTYQEQGAEAALKEAGVEVAMTAAGGVVGKAGAKTVRYVINNKHYQCAEEAWRAYVASNSTLMGIFEAASNAAGAISSGVAKIAEKIGGSRIGQALYKVEHTVEGLEISYARIKLKWGGGIQEQGYPWEDYLASILPRGTRLPQNFKTYDFYDEATKIAISAKTLNTMSASKLANPEQVYHSLKKNIDAMLNFEVGDKHGIVLTPEIISIRELRVAIHKKTNVLQLEQIARAATYAKDNNVRLILTMTE